MASRYFKRYTKIPDAFKRIPKARSVPNKWMFPLFNLERAVHPSTQQLQKARELFRSGGSFIGTQNDQLQPGSAEPERIEIAIVGRSNAGKSTLLNALFGQELCSTSKRPGLTKTLNFYRVGHSPLVLVDLPGYGYAAGQPQEIKDAWMQLISGYLYERSGNAPMNSSNDKSTPHSAETQSMLNIAYRRILRRVMLLMDIRRGVTELDEELIEMMEEFGIPFHVVLTKADTLSEDRRKASIELVRSRLQSLVTVFPTLNVVSSRTQDGLQELKATLALTAKVDRL